MSDDDAIGAARLLIGAADVLALVTTDGDGNPAISQVPFVIRCARFGIVISGLAAHTQHLQRRPRAAVLIGAGATAGDDPFARPRIAIDAAVSAVTDRPKLASIWDAFALRSAETTAILRTLPDFRVFALAPIRARLVLGFGRAYDLDGAELFRD